MSVATGRMVVPKKSQFEGQVKSALAGIEKYVPETASFVLNGSTRTQGEIVKSLTETLQLFQDVRDARSAAKQALEALHDELAPRYRLYTSLERSMQAYFGKGSPQLLDFGIALGVQGPRSAEMNVQAKARAQLTRALRHTMGSRQKAAIRFEGAPSVVTYGPDGKVLAGQVPTVKRDAPPAAPEMPGASAAAPPWEGAPGTGNEGN